MLSYLIVSKKEDNVYKSFLTKDLNLKYISSCNNGDVNRDAKFFPTKEDAILTLESFQILTRFSAVDFEIVKARVQQGSLQIKECVYTQTSKDTERLMQDIAQALV